MDLSYTKVYDILKDRGVDEIFHANSVLTACHFLRTGRLMSRGAVELANAKQTAQSSDALDKKYSIWFDVFADSVDIHSRAKRRNVYGPVLFVLDLEFLRRGVGGRVWVTKLNPTKWPGTASDARWFGSTDELESSFTKGTFDYMLVFRHCGGEVPLKGNLKKIILDDPGVFYKDDNIDFYSMAYGALDASMSVGDFKVKIEKRKCTPSCKCAGEYEDLDMAVSMFEPRLLSIG